MLVLRTKTRRIPETMVLRILLFTRSVGPPSFWHVSGAHHEKSWSPFPSAMVADRRRDSSFKSTRRLWRLLPGESPKTNTSCLRAHLFISGAPNCQTQVSFKHISGPESRFTIYILGAPAFEGQQMIRGWGSETSLHDETPAQAFFKGPTDHINIRFLHAGDKAQYKGNPDVMVCRILMFMSMWFVWALFLTSSPRAVL